MSKSRGETVKKKCTISHCHSTARFLRCPAALLQRVPGTCCINCNVYPVHVAFGGSFGDMTRVAVVGNGLFGAAATRHLAELDHDVDVLCIGAPPQHGDIRPAPQSDVPSHAVYSSHNDAARLTRRHSKGATLAEITDRAIGRYRTIEADAQIPFFHDVGCLIVSRPGGDGLSADPIESMNAMGIDHTHFPVGDRSWQDRWPALEFPTTHYAVFEPSPAGYIRPKSLIAAQNVLAEQSGAQIIADTVIGVEHIGQRYRIQTAGGPEYDADHVLVASGAFSNFNDLLPAPIATTLKSEVIVLGEVNTDDAQRLANYPTVKYLLDPDDLNDIYMVPPVQYENGRHYIKMGANTRLDQWFEELPAIQRWFNAETDPDYLPLYEPALRAIWPSVNFLSIETRPCIITYTTDQVPLITALGDGLFIATAGNGASAKDSDAWGENAATLIFEHL